MQVVGNYSASESQKKAAAMIINYQSEKDRILGKINDDDQEQEEQEQEQEQQEQQQQQQEQEEEERWH